MPTKRSRSSQPSWLVPICVAAAAVLLVTLVLVLAQNDSAGSAAVPTSEKDRTEDGPGLSSTERRDEADPLADGPVDAPVVLIVFSDYQCPFCAKWSSETLPLMMEHVTTGDLRIEWRDVNVFGEASERAARASYAAALQDQFWQYHHALFADGDIRSEDELTDEALASLADDLGLDIDRFTTDFDGQTVAHEIERNARLGIDLGVYSTPAFILDGQPIMGAQPSDVFTEALDTALAARK